MNTSLIIESRKESTKKQKSITDINPEASDQELLAFGQELINLTNNTYVSTTKIDKRNLDTDTKPARQIQTILYLWYNGNFGTYTEAPASGIINLPLSNVYSKTLGLSIKQTVTDDTAMKITDMNDSDTENPMDIIEIGFGGPCNPSGGTIGAWFVQFATAAMGTSRVITPRTFSFKASFPATSQFDAWEKTFTFNITEEG